MRLLLNHPETTCAAINCALQLAVALSIIGMWKGLI